MMTMIKTSVLCLLCANTVAAFAPHPTTGSAFVGGASKISVGRYYFMSLAVAVVVVDIISSH